jgi:hypothetical protein
VLQLSPGVTTLSPWRGLLDWLAEYWRGVSCALAGPLQESIDFCGLHPELVDNNRSIQKHRLADGLLLLAFP